MGDFDTFSSRRKKHRVVADDIATPDGPEADRRSISNPGYPLPTINRNISKVPPGGARKNFSHANRRT